jgi:Mg/Co/Ni transporter MgtE
MAEERDHSLSLAFMRGHPAQAARVLESIAADETAQLFKQTPARLGAAVLSAMLPHRAAACIEKLDDARALELLSLMGTQATVAVLRYLPESRREGLVSGLPTATALASTMLLGYSEDTLGAWADPDVVVLPADTRATQALERMRQEPETQSLVFVADSDRRLVGHVNLGALLQAPDGAKLTTLMQVPAHVLAAHAPLSAIPDHPGWATRSVMPVVEPGGRLIGVMTRDALTRALRRAAPPSTAGLGGESTLPVLFARAYWQALSGLLEGGLAWLPRVNAVAMDVMEKSDER